jgi:hypothetical protein
VPVHHLGYQNLLAYLEALKATFTPPHVALFGSSAGGFGVYTDFAAVADTFPVPIHMIDDSGPELQNVYVPPGSAAQLADAWNTKAAVPAGCKECFSNDADGGLAALAPFLSSTYPRGRMAVVSSLSDGEISQRYQMDGGAYAEALTSLANDVLTRLPNWRYFYLAGNTHTVLEGAMAQDSSCGRGKPSWPGLACGQTLQQFIADELTAPLTGWQSAMPPDGAPGTWLSWDNHSYCAMGQ